MADFDRLSATVQGAADTLSLIGLLFDPNTESDQPSSQTVQSALYFVESTLQKVAVEILDAGDDVKGAATHD